MFGLGRKTGKSKEVDASSASIEFQDDAQSSEPTSQDTQVEDVPPTSFQHITGSDSALVLPDPLVQDEADDAHVQDEADDAHVQDEADDAHVADEADDATVRDEADDTLFLDEADEIIALPADSSDADGAGSFQEISNMQSAEIVTESMQPATSENPTSDKAILHIGPGTVLKGDITTCESLIVQGNLNGTVEASVVLVAQGGVVDGTVNVQTAEIEGTFTGTLTVKGLLSVKGGGQIQGTVRYGELEIERGCQLNGDISQHDASTSKSTSSFRRARGSDAAVAKAA